MGPAATLAVRESRAIPLIDWLFLQLGGNAALIKYFKDRGLNDLPIRDKYNTPEAENYRERCVGRCFERSVFICVCRGRVSVCECLTYH